jgi:hypothetical protein
VSPSEATPKTPAGPPAAQSSRVGFLARPPTPINPVSQRIIAALRKKHPMD